MPLKTGGEKPVLLSLWLRLIGPVSNISFLQPHQTERYSSKWLAADTGAGHLSQDLMGRGRTWRGRVNVRHGREREAGGGQHAGCARWQAPPQGQDRRH